MNLDIGRSSRGSCSIVSLRVEQASRRRRLRRLGEKDFQSSRGSCSIMSLRLEQAWRRRILRLPGEKDVLAMSNAKC